MSANTPPALYSPSLSYKIIYIEAGHQLQGFHYLYLMVLIIGIIIHLQQSWFKSADITREFYCNFLFMTNITGC